MVKQNKFGDLTKSEMNNLAWKIVLKNHTKGLLFVITLASLCFLIYFFSVWVIERGFAKFVIYIIGGLVLIALLGFYFWAKKEKEYTNLFGKNSSWKENTGRRPGVQKVNAEYRNKEIKSNANPENLDWNVDSDNPIVSYMIKK